MATQNNKQNPLDNYITVAERIASFYNSYPQGRIFTSIIQHDVDSGFILMRAEVFRATDDAQPAATGHAFEVRGESYVNKTSYVENCETGAVGRALALLGFEVKRGIASREEFEKVARMQPPDKGAARPTLRPPAEDDATHLDADILQSAGELGYDAAKVRKWVNQKYEVTGGLESLTAQDKREVLRVFREKVQAEQPKPAGAK